MTPDDPENPPPENPAPEFPSPEPTETKESTFTHTRTGKVARLPKTARDQLNYMLLDNVPFAKVIENLGEQGKGLNEKNVTNWKAGGYLDWLRDLQRNEALQTTRDAALDLLNQKTGATVQDAGRTIAGAQLYELLLSFDPTAFAAALAEKPELYLRIISCLARLSEGEAVCSHRRAQQSAVETKASAPKTAGKAVITKETLMEIARLVKLV